MTPPIDTKGAVEAVPVAWSHEDDLPYLQQVGRVYVYSTKPQGKPVALYSAADYTALSERLASAERERDEANKAALDWKAIAGDEFKKRESAERDLSKARSELAEVRKELDRLHGAPFSERCYTPLLQDARRYRWLRSRSWGGSGAYYFKGPAYTDGVTIDAAIDTEIAALSAMREEK